MHYNRHRRRLRIIYDCSRIKKIKNKNKQEIRTKNLPGEKQWPKRYRVDLFFRRQAARNLFFRRLLITYRVITDQHNIIKSDNNGDNVENVCNHHRFCNAKFWTYCIINIIHNSLLLLHLIFYNFCQSTTFRWGVGRIVFFTIVITKIRLIYIQL